MDFFTRTRTLVFIILLLLCMNIGMLILFLVGRPETLPHAGSARDPEQEQARIEQVLKQELGFDHSQIKKFISLRGQHKARMRTLQEEMRLLKNQMFDRVLLDGSEARLSDSLLILTQQTQNKIEYQTFMHLLDVKQLCTPKQRQKLGILLRELLRRKPGAEAPAPRDS